MGGKKGGDMTIHWLRRERLCKSKNEGGLGIRDLMMFNKALLAKQEWRLTQDDHSLLGRVLKARYYPRGSFFSAQLDFALSYTSRSILEGGREMLRGGMVWIVGVGHDIRVWKDPWLWVELCQE